MMGKVIFGVVKLKKKHWYSVVMFDFDKLN